MTSPKQVEANRKNAMRSTGPKTEKGKQVSRMNALTHGLTAKHVVIEGEDPEEFERLLDGLIEEYAPRTILEQQLTEHLASHLWRLKRIPVFEAAIIELNRHAVQEEHVEKSQELSWRDRVNVMTIHYKMKGETHPADPEKEGFLDLEKYEAAKEKETCRLKELRKLEALREIAEGSILELGPALLRDAGQNNSFGKLSRYEVQQLNSVERMIRQLEKLRDKRIAEYCGSAQLVKQEPDKSED